MRRFPFTLITGYKAGSDFVKKFSFVNISSKGILHFSLSCLYNKLSRLNLRTLQQEVSNLEQKYYDTADQVIALHGAEPSSLIPIIQDIQSELRYLPGELLSYVAEK